MSGFLLLICGTRQIGGGIYIKKIVAIAFKGGDIMKKHNINYTPIRNLNGKLVCNVDHLNKVIEIVQKGATTIIQVNANGEFEITHR